MGLTYRGIPRALGIAAFATGFISLESTCEERELYVADSIAWQIEEAFTSDSVDKGRTFAYENVGWEHYALGISLMVAGGAGMFVRVEEKEKKSPIEMPEPKS